MAEWIARFDAQRCISLSIVFAGLAAMSEGLHNLFNAREFQATGLFSWTVRRRFHPAVYSDRFARISWLPDSLASAQTYWALTIVQLICSALMVLPAYRNHMLLFVGVLLAIQIASRLRNGEYGTDESSALQLFLLTGLTIYFLPVPENTRVLGIWFIAFQTLLSYLACGVAKLVFPIWQNGTAIEETLGTMLFGNRTVQRFIKNQRAGRLLSWSVLAFECVLPFAVLVNPIWCIAFLALGFCFHVAIAVVMGLNSFLFPVIGCYPSLLYLSLSVHKLR